MPDYAPKLSVVIACVNGLPSIDECLMALAHQEGDHEAEIIVANCARDGSARHIAVHFSHVRLLDFDERLGIPELRAIGIEAATGDIICIIEDHCMVDARWFEEIVKAHAAGPEAVGGAVENGSEKRLVDWAVYLCEYSGAMLPVPSGEADGIPGNNAAYKREALEQVDDDLLRHHWEYFIHDEMKAAGVRFHLEPDMLVRHKKEFGIRYFLKQRFYYSRSFAGMRRSRLSPARRLAYALASPLLAPLMLYRTARAVSRKRRHVGKLLQSFPLLAAFMVSYALGEGVGYLLGPGNSLSKVE